MMSYLNHLYAGLFLSSANHWITLLVLCHWLNFVFNLISLLMVCRMALLILPICGFAGLMSRADFLVTSRDLKFSFPFLSVINAFSSEWMCKVELEAKAIKYDILKCRHYLLGNPGFTVITDHRLLVPVFAKGISDMLNIRILWIRERLANFSFEVKWQAGKIHCIADALSRAPVFGPDEEEPTEDVQVGLTVSKYPHFAKLREAANADKEYLEQLEAVQHGGTNS